MDGYLFHVVQLLDCYMEIDAGLQPDIQFFICNSMT